MWLFNGVEQAEHKGVNTLVYDYSKLIGRIIEKCGTQGNFAQLMGLTERTVSLKLNNKVPWTQPDIDKASTILDIAVEDLHSYFFAKNVQFA